MLGIVNIDKLVGEKIGICDIVSVEGYNDSYSINMERNLTIYNPTSFTPINRIIVSHITIRRNTNIDNVYPVIFNEAGESNIGYLHKFHFKNPATFIQRVIELGILPNKLIC